MLNSKQKFGLGSSKTSTFQPSSKVPMLFPCRWSLRFLSYAEHAVQRGEEFASATLIAAASRTTGTTTAAAKQSKQQITNKQKLLVQQNQIARWLQANFKFLPPNRRKTRGFGREAVDRCLSLLRHQAAVRHARAHRGFGDDVTPTTLHMEASKRSVVVCLLRHNHHHIIIINCAWSVVVLSLAKLPSLPHEAL